MRPLGDVAGGVAENLPTGNATIVIEVTGAKRAIAKMLRSFVGDLAGAGHRVDRASMTGGVRYDVTDSAIANQRVGTILDAG